MATPALLGHGIVWMPAPPPQQYLLDLFGERLQRWGTGLPRGNHDPTKVAGADRVRAAIAEIDKALAALGDKTGERADDVRKHLTAERERIGTALANYEPIGEDFDGPRAREMIAKVTAARQVRAQAEAVLQAATRATVKSAREELDLIEADGRELDREIAQTFAGIGLPALPDVTDFAAAKAQTSEIMGGNATAHPATTLSTALDQGATSKPSVARLWVCFEGSGAVKPGSLLEWRWRRFQEPR